MKQIMALASGILLLGLASITYAGQSTANTMVISGKTSEVVPMKMKRADGHVVTVFVPKDQAKELKQGDKVEMTTLSEESQIMG